MKSRRGERSPTRDGVAAVALVGGDAGGEGGGHEAVGLARAEVVERAHPDHAEPLAEVGLQAEEVGGDLAGGVGAGRAEGRGLGERELRLGDHAVHVGAADRQRPGRTPARRAGEQHVEGALGVGPERRRPGRAHEPPTSAQPARWYTASGADVGDGGGHGRSVGDVDRAIAVAVEHVDLVAARAQVLDQVAADEAQPSRHERAHRPDPSERRVEGRQDGSGGMPAGEEAGRVDGGPDPSAQRRGVGSVGRGAADASRSVPTATDDPAERPGPRDRRRPGARRGG